MKWRRRLPRFLPLYLFSLHIHTYTRRRRQCHPWVRGACVRQSSFFCLHFSRGKVESSPPPLKREAKESEEEGRKESTMWEKWNSRVGCFERNRTDGGRVQSVENLPHSIFFSFATVGMRAKSSCVGCRKERGGSLPPSPSGQINLH